MKVDYSRVFARPWGGIASSYEHNLDDFVYWTITINQYIFLLRPWEMIAVINPHLHFELSQYIGNEDAQKDLDIMFKVFGRFRKICTLHEIVDCVNKIKEYVNNKKEV